jgi:C-terminal processing protease CtpA/Prc
MPRAVAMAIAGITGIGVGSTALMPPLATSPWWAGSALLAMALLAGVWIRERERVPASAYLIGLETVGLGTAGFLYAGADALRLPGVGLDLMAGFAMAATNATFLLQHKQTGDYGLKVVAMNLAATGVALVAFSLAVHVPLRNEWRDVMALGATLLAAAAAAWYWVTRVKAPSRGAVLAMAIFAAAYGWVAIQTLGALARNPLLTRMLIGALLGGLLVFAWLQFRRERGPSRIAGTLEPDRGSSNPPRALETLAVAVVGTWMLIVFFGIFALGIAHSGPSDLVAKVAGIVPDAGERLFIQVAMRDRYLWYDQTAAGAPKATDGTSARLPRANQDRFSYMVSSADYEAWVDHGRFVGLGLGLLPQPDGAAIAYVVQGSPAARSGLQRGLRIIAVDGKSVGQEISHEDFIAGGLNTTAALTIADPAGNQATVSLNNAWVEERQPTIHANFLQDGRRVGYLFVRSLNPGAARKIADAVRELHYRDVSELVLDLRYASSGVSDVALYLASLVAGKASEGKVLARFVYNDKYRDRNYEDILTPQPASLDLGRVAVITGPATCGAAELLINGLRPYLEVTTVGAPTCGRPVGTESIQFAYKRLILAVSRIYNARGEGEYFQGITPRCPVADDLLRPLGHPDEAALREALRFLATDSCSDGAPEGGSPALPVQVLRQAPGLRTAIWLY